MAFRINRSFLERKEKMKKFFLITAIICSAVLGNNVFAAENFAEKYRAAAERGNAKDQFALGMSLISGVGCERNLDEGIKWMTKAAEQGYIPAIYNLGFFYLRGLSTTKIKPPSFVLKDETYKFPKDRNKAAYFFQKGADLGNTGCQCMLGLCYEKGFGVKQDMKEAVKWYRKAARRGDKMAKNHLKKLGISIY